jgi:hypothetical protein
MKISLKSSGVLDVVYVVSAVPQTALNVISALLETFPELSDMYFKASAVSQTPLMPIYSV